MVFADAIGLPARGMRRSRVRCVTFPRATDTCDDRVLLLRSTGRARGGQGEDARSPERPPNEVLERLERSESDAASDPRPGAPAGPVARDGRQRQRAGQPHGGALARAPTLPARPVGRAGDAADEDMAAAGHVTVVEHAPRPLDDATADAGFTAAPRWAAPGAAEGAAGRRSGSRTSRLTPSDCCRRLRTSDGGRRASAAARRRRKPRSEHEAVRSDVRCRWRDDGEGALDPLRAYCSTNVVTPLPLPNAAPPRRDADERAGAREHGSRSAEADGDACVGRARGRCPAGANRSGAVSRGAAPIDRTVRGSASPTRHGGGVAGRRRRPRRSTWPAPMSARARPPARDGPSIRDEQPAAAATSAVRRGGGPRAICQRPRRS